MSFFFSNFTLNEIINSDNIDQNLQNLFSIARFLNAFYCFIYTFLIFKILRKLNIKKTLCFVSIILLLTFHTIYEILFLIRSEILSIIFVLLSFYLLLKFVKNNKNPIYCFFSGFFLCFALLAKIQVIFLIFIFVSIFPFLFSYYNYKDISYPFLKNKKIFIVSSILFGSAFLAYIIFELFFTFSLLIEKFNIFFYKLSIPHLIDPIIFTLFIMMYFLILKYISKKIKLNLISLVSLSYTIIYGFIFCLIFIYFLDFAKIITFDDRILFLFSNPIHKMSYYGWGTYNPEATADFNFGQIIQSIKEIFYFNAKIFPNKNLTIEFSGIIIGVVDFFRFMNIFIVGILFLILIFKKKTNINLIIIFLFFAGILLLNLSFSVRDSYGYNIYIYPLFLITVFICLGQIGNKYMISSFLIVIFISSFVEFYLLKNYYKLQFTRENRIYGICKIEKWKNSENYIANYELNSYIPLTKNPYKVLSLFTNMDKKFFDNYCGQVENKTSWKSNFFNIMIN